jgi:hypothetical protein
MKKKKFEDNVKLLINRANDMMDLLQCDKKVEDDPKVQYSEEERGLLQFLDRMNDDSEEFRKIWRFFYNEKNRNQLVREYLQWKQMDNDNNVLAKIKRAITFFNE